MPGYSNRHRQISSVMPVMIAQADMCDMCKGRAGFVSLYHHWTFESKILRHPKPLYAICMLYNGVAASRFM